jgi:hypothetical protein
LKTWLIRCSGVLLRHQATNVPTSAPSSCLPGLRVL